MSIETGVCRRKLDAFTTTGVEAETGERGLRASDLPASSSTATDKLR
jgi:hypothetical protein